MNICLYIFSLISVITMKSCTYQDSFPVLVCAKFHCDQISISWTATMKIFIGFGILSKRRQWDWCLVPRTVLHFSQFGEANTLVTKDTGKIGVVNMSTLVYHTCLTTGVSVRNVHIYGDFYGSKNIFYRYHSFVLIYCHTVYPKKYAHGFVVLCFVVVMQSFIMNLHEVFIHIHQGCFAGTGAIVRLPQCQWSKPGGYGKISQWITTTKHSKAKTVCIFLGIYCISNDRIAQMKNIDIKMFSESLYWHGLTGVRTWISNYIHSILWIWLFIHALISTTL